jgi:hypothetical protein
MALFYVIIDNLQYWNIIGEVELDRRQFLKIAVATPLALSLYSPIEILANSERPFSQQDAFENPLVVIDKYSDLLRQTPSAEAAKFINLTSNPDNRYVIDKMYKTDGYGNLVYALYKRANQIDIAGHFSFCSDWWVFADIYDGWKSGKENAGWKINEVKEKLTNILNVGKNLEKYNSYEEQKDALIRNARNQENVELTSAAQKYTGIPIFVDALYKYLPSSFQPFVKKIDIDPNGGYMSHFTRDDACIHLSSYHAENGFNNPYTLKANAFSIFTKILLHEDSHAFDPQFLGKYVPIYDTLHPKDTFEHLEPYIFMFEKFYEGIDNFDQKSLKQIFNTWLVYPQKFNDHQFSNNEANHLEGSMVSGEIKDFYANFVKGNNRKVLSDIGMKDFFRGLPDSQKMFFYFVALRRLAKNNLIDENSKWFVDYHALKTQWIEQTLFHIMTGPCGMNLINTDITESEFARADRLKKQMYNVEPKMRDWLGMVFYYAPAWAYTAKMKMWGADRTGLMIPGNPDPSSAIVKFAKLLTMTKKA